MPRVRISLSCIISCLTLVHISSAIEPMSSHLSANESGAFTINSAERAGVSPKSLFKQEPVGSISTQQVNGIDLMPENIEIILDNQNQNLEDDILVESPLNNSFVRIHVQVINNGSVSAQSFWIELYLDGQIVGQLFVDEPLDPGGRGVWYFGPGTLSGVGAHRLECRLRVSRDVNIPNNFLTKDFNILDNPEDNPPQPTPTPVDEQLNWDVNMFFAAVLLDDQDGDPVNDRIVTELEAYQSFRIGFLITNAGKLKNSFSADLYFLNYYGNNASLSADIEPGQTLTLYYEPMQLNNVGNFQYEIHVRCVDEDLLNNVYRGSVNVKESYVPPTPTPVLPTPTPVYSSEAEIPTILYEFDKPTLKESGWLEIPGGLEGNIPTGEVSLVTFPAQWSSHSYDLKGVELKTDPGEGSLLIIEKPIENGGYPTLIKVHARVDYPEAGIAVLALKGSLSDKNIDGSMNLTLLPNTGRYTTFRPITILYEPEDTYNFTLILQANTPAEGGRSTTVWIDRVEVFVLKPQTNYKGIFFDSGVNIPGGIRR